MRAPPDRVFALFVAGAIRKGNPLARDGEADGRARGIVDRDLRLNQTSHVNDAEDDHEQHRHDQSKLNEALASGTLLIAPPESLEGEAEAATLWLRCVVHTG
jgi:hypothetical protein